MKKIIQATAWLPTGQWRVIPRLQEPDTLHLRLRVTREARGHMTRWQKVLCIKKLNLSSLSGWGTGWKRVGLLSRAATSSDRLTAAFRISQSFFPWRLSHLLTRLPAQFISFMRMHIWTLWCGWTNFMMQRRGRIKAKLINWTPLKVAAMSALGQWKYDGKQ